MGENKWKTISSKESYKTPYFSVHEDEVVRPDGSPGKYYVIEQKSGISIVPVTAENNIYLIGQYRYTTNQFSWEVPAGGYEGGDLTEEAGRELLEETGLVSEEWEKIGTFQVLNGSANHLNEVFLAKSVRQTGTNKQAEEGISEMCCIPFTEVADMIKSGKLTDSESVSALMIAGLHLGLI